MEAVRTSETSVDNYFTLQYIPEDKSEGRTSLQNAMIFSKLEKCNTMYEMQNKENSNM
jgi:hypothetical protein